MIRKKITCISLAVLLFCSTWTDTFCIFGAKEQKTAYDESAVMDELDSECDSEQDDIEDEMVNETNEENSAMLDEQQNTKNDEHNATENTSNDEIEQTSEFLQEDIEFICNDSKMCIDNICVPANYAQANGLKTVNYNMNLIKQVGEQGTKMCMAYTLAYCRTILDGKVHNGSEYWNGKEAIFGDSKYYHSGANNKQSFLKMIVDQINAGRPVGMYCKGNYREGRWANPEHWVAVIGYKTSADLNNLKTSDFYMIDPGQCECYFFLDNESAFVYSTSNLLLTNDGGNPTPTHHDPFGNVELIQGGAGNVYVGGWALDLDEPMESVGIHVYVGDTLCGVLTASLERPDVGIEYPGTGGFHGFSGWIDTDHTGNQIVRVYAINRGGGSNCLIGTGEVTITEKVQFHVPVGALDSVSGGKGCVSVYGWSFDEDEPTEPVTIHVYVGNPGVFCGILVANTKRSDVGNKFPGVGKYHGFSGQVNTELRGEQIVRVYAVNRGDGGNDLNVLIGSGTATISEKDTTPPVINDAQIINVDTAGYTVICTVDDDGGIENIDRVQFPTWTNDNGQDDFVMGSGIQDGHKFAYRVNDSDHNFERGMYTTDIYVYDRYGNYSVTRLSTDIQNLFSPRSRIKSETGNAYEVYDDLLTWDDAKKFCEEKGGHLVTITSQQEEDIVESLLLKGTAREGYYIGLDMITKKWVTGEPLEYAKWKPGEPNNTNENETVGEFQYTEKDGWGWNDQRSNRNSRGFILEYDKPDDRPKLQKLSINKKYAVIEVGKTVQLVADCESTQDAKNVKLTWASNDANVAVVDKNGLVTAVSSGQTIISVSGGGLSQNCTIKVVTSTNPGEETDDDMNDPDSPDYDVMYVGSIEDQHYTGAAIKPNIIVYHGNKRLTAGKDYTVTYKNNINASTSDKPACAIIKGIGDYSETKNVYFKILPADISGAVIENVASPYNGKIKSVLPKASYNNKGLKKNIDYKVESGGTSFREAGNYSVIYKGINNYTGSITGCVTIYTSADKNKSLKNARVTLESKSYGYTGSSIKPAVKTVSLNGKILTGNQDYEVKYGVNKAIGKGIVLIQGKGQYFGSKKISFQISKGAGKPVSAGMLQMGTAMLYEKGGCSPKPYMVDNGRTLTRGIDYTYSYKNNKKVGTGTIIIKGKGAYTGTIKKDFTIVARDISKVSMRAPDIMANKKSAYKSPPVLIDSNGKILAKGTDYKDIQYFYNGVPISKELSLQDGAEITVKVCGNGNYSGTATTTYKFRSANAISKAKINIPEKIYTGKAVKLEAADMIVVLNGIKLTYGKDFEIIQGSYNNNIKKGAATVMIRGIGNYIGEKKVKFKIKARSINKL